MEKKRECTRERKHKKIHVGHHLMQIDYIHVNLIVWNVCEGD